MLHVVCTRLSLDHLCVRVGGSSGRNEEIVTILELRLSVRSLSLISLSLVQVILFSFFLLNFILMCIFCHISATQYRSVTHMVALPVLRQKSHMTSMVPSHNPSLVHSVQIECNTISRLGSSIIRPVYLPQLFNELCSYWQLQAWWTSDNYSRGGLAITTGGVDW